MDYQGSHRARGLLRGVVLPAGLLLCGCAGLDFRHALIANAETAKPDGNASSEADDRPSSGPPAPQMASVEPPRTPSAMPKPLLPPKKPPVPRAKEQSPPPPNIAINDLIGSDFTSILQVFRSPDSVQSNALSVVWTYSPPGCTLQLFFYPDIQTAKFHLLKYDLKNTAGEMLGIGDPCMQGVLTLRSRGAALP